MKLLLSSLRTYLAVLTGNLKDFCAKFDMKLLFFLLVHIELGIMIHSYKVVFAKKIHLVTLANQQQSIKTCENASFAQVITLKSAADKTRHMRMFHRLQK